MTKFLNYIFFNFINKEIITTTVNDAFPYFRSIENYSPHPAPKEIRNELARSKKVNLKPGIYDFYFKSFCLNAGKYSPSLGSGYLLAPFKGRNSQIIKHILENSLIYPGIPQFKIQTLIWAILSNIKYGDLSKESQLLIDKLLKKDELNLLGKSFLDKIPKSIRTWLWRKIKNRLPNEIFSVFESIDNIKSGIKNTQMTYKELESVAVRFGKPPIPKKMPKVKPGLWSLVKKRCFVRVFPEGYSKTRMQVYIPERVVPYLDRDRLERINRLGIKDGIDIKITFDDSPESSKITLHDGREIPVWNFKKLEFSASKDSGTIEMFEIKNAGWVARDLKILASLDSQKYPEIKNRIENAVDICNDIQIFKKIASKESKNHKDALDNIRDIGHYYDGIDAILKDMSKGIGFKEKMKWLLDHFKKLMDAYGNIGGMLGNISEESDSEMMDFSPDDIMAIPANANEQRLGFDGLFEEFE